MCLFLVEKRQSSHLTIGPRGQPQRTAVGSGPPWLSGERGFTETLGGITWESEPSRESLFFLCLTPGTGVSLCLCGACCSLLQGPGVQPHGPRAHFSLAGWSCFATCPAVTLAVSSVSEQEWWWLQHPHRPAHRARTPFCPTLTAAASAGLGCRYSASSWRRP